MNSIEASKRKHVDFNKVSCTGDVVKLNNSNVNTSEQGCVDITHVNRFAILCIDSSEDEGDSLNFDTVNDPDASCTFRVVKVSECIAN